jgi:hypothetical protein
VIYEIKTFEQLAAASLARQRFLLLPFRADDCGRFRELSAGPPREPDRPDDGVAAGVGRPQATRKQ